MSEEERVRTQPFAACPVPAAPFALGNKLVSSCARQEISSLAGMSLQTAWAAACLSRLKAGGKEPSEMSGTSAEQVVGPPSVSPGTWRWTDVEGDSPQQW